MAKKLNQDIIQAAVSFVNDWPQYLTGTDAERYAEIAAMPANERTDRQHESLTLLHGVAVAVFAYNPQNQTHHAEMIEAARQIATDIILQERGEIRAYMIKHGYTDETMQALDTEHVGKDLTKAERRLADTFSESALQDHLRNAVFHCEMAILSSKANHKTRRRIGSLITDLVAQRWTLGARTDGVQNYVVPHTPLRPAATMTQGTSGVGRAMCEASANRGKIVKYPALPKTKKRARVDSAVTVIRNADLALQDAFHPADLQVLYAAYSIRNQNGLQTLNYGELGRQEGVIFSALSIYRTLTTPDAVVRPDSKILADFEAAFARMSLARVRLDVEDELKRREVSEDTIKLLSVTDYLLPIEDLELCQYGQVVQAHITKGDPRFFAYLDAIGQVCSFDPVVRSIQKVGPDGRLLYVNRKVGGKVAQVPALVPINSMEKVAMLGYMEERVATYKNAVSDEPKRQDTLRKAAAKLEAAAAKLEAEGKKEEADAKRKEARRKREDADRGPRLHPVIKMDTMIERCGLDGPHLRRELAFAEQVFRYWQAIEWINGFDPVRQKRNGGNPLEAIHFQWEANGSR
ncbi:hypothetical protein HDR58_03330 [bacterium]|nr:hypothetical protein [bacterium]